MSRYQLLGVVAALVLGPLAYFSPVSASVAGSPYVKFGGVVGIAADSHGNVYIADGHGHRIDKLVSHGKAIAITPKSMAPKLHNCGGLAADSHGNLFVVGCSGFKLAEFSPKGKLLEQWNSGAESYSYVAIDPQGRAVATSFNTGRIDRFTLGQKKPKLVTWAISYPAGIAIDGQGNIYISYTDRITKLSPDGKVLSTSPPISTPQNEIYLQGVALDSHGNVYVSNAPQTVADRVIKLSSALKVSGVVTKRGTKPGRVHSPLGVAVDSHDRVYVVDHGNNRIEKFSPTGRLLAMTLGG